MPDPHATPRPADRDGPDVTELHETQRLRALLACIVESSDDAIVSKSLDGIVTSWNAAAERIFGYTADEMIGRPINVIIPPELQEEEVSILQRLRNGERIAHFETVRVAKSGRRIDMSLTISPLLDSEGRIFGASKVARDTTEQRAAEEALKEADRRKDEFIAMLAHELRNPLAPIGNTLEILKQKGAAPHETETIERQLGHLVRLVDDLLDVDRITRGKVAIVRERVELADVVRQAVETCGSLPERSDRRPTVDLPDTPIYLHADSVRLTQALGNLLNNALKYTEPDGRVSLTARLDDETVTVAVKDDGIGIATENLSCIFDLFTQVDDSPERAQKGLGVGLTLAKRMVEMHDGTIEAISNGRGGGSEFVIRLPILEVAAGPVPAPTAVKHSAKPRRILVVDDNEDSATSLATLLELKGHETHTASDGLAALSVAARTHPDVVLLDIGLPHKNGYEVCREIRREAWGEDVLIIAVTGWGQEQDRRQSEDAGFNGHLIKPIDFIALSSFLDP
ncbi:MAG TPA: PAS domain S-box protein [Gammaproteobacteria bacterium]|nr:PAS domain S-box protein [Gammaproteobacteria bacterium]